MRRAPLSILCLWLAACGPPQGPQAATVAPPPRASKAAPTLDARDVTQTLRAGVQPATRRKAIDDYARGEGDSRPLLEALYADPDPIVRRWAALALARRADPGLASALQQAACSEPEAAIQRILTEAVADARSDS